MNNEFIRQALRFAIILTLTLILIFLIFRANAL
nr:MAG TPA: hypothetical protein [Caudoviricetes sp.]